MYSWCRYRASLEPALRHFDAEINSKETVGVAGRTGSGKSTLMLTLFRMYELSNGRIKIDDVDISKVGLHQLRKRRNGQEKTPTTNPRKNNRVEATPSPTPPRRPPKPSPHLQVY